MCLMESKGFSLRADLILNKTWLPRADWHHYSPLNEISANLLIPMYTKSITIWNYMDLQNNHHPFPRSHTKRSRFRTTRRLSRRSYRHTGAFELRFTFGHPHPAHRKHERDSNLAKSLDSKFIYRGTLEDVDMAKISHESSYDFTHGNENEVEDSES